ncbi:phenol 2-monooxygenase [Pyrenophora tritici-repentis Pt-1C-BFP]|uniref:Phenol 2-monooxygenase n=1 Tax=Pyrenophora tritici-repentis (strain Pt-1C-BFP) TaxID=426418 RepID=B2W840_PYRTR|nr:phenol 2-monooxygenase [Pyrenophora tritici-repentis Pt-1C-BFP]EDU48898.1 phenol 2-monooxygenase [Pyrenophora tritici-repentis Pt-1C-BFP]
MPQTDVLIAGSGSAGVFAATWLAIYNIPFTILERRDGPLKIGQADGVQVRTVEIYESFGLSEELLRESYHILEVCFWGFDEDANGKAQGDIRRKSRTIDTEQGLSHLPHVILNQARMNGIMLEKMESVLKEQGRWKEGTSNGIEYGWAVKGLEIDETRKHDPNAHCVKVTAEKAGKEEVWEAKYVLGCDGAHSTIRKALDIRMLGDTSDTVWGVMDIYPLTNFPDIRRKCVIHSTSGNLLIIPREGGQLARFYIQLPAGVQPKEVKLADLQDQARRIFAPYSMEFAGVFWWSAYSIGQRLASAFHAHNRVFLTGDACHTHSPKAGQGMNVSIQDGYNIGWKLGSVLSGLSPPSLIPTYVTERGKTAADLIAFDKELTKKIGRKEEYEGEFADYFIKSGRYTAGFTAKYEDSMITSGESAGGRVNLATGITVGMRFPSAQVIRFCDCKAIQLQSVIKSDAKWRVVVFGGDINQPDHHAQLRKLANTLEAIARRYTPATNYIDSVIESILVLTTKFTETKQEHIPDYFWPKSGKWGIRDLHKTYIDDEHYNSGHGHAYQKYGVDPSAGAIVLVRPDQYVSKVTTLDDLSGISKFFEGCLLEQKIPKFNPELIVVLCRF